jgi:hypothetical protein
MKEKQERPIIYAALEGIRAIDEKELIFASAMPRETLRLVEAQLTKQQWVSEGIVKVDENEYDLLVKAPVSNRLYSITARKD